METNSLARLMFGFACMDRELFFPIGKVGGYNYIITRKHAFKGPFERWIEGIKSCLSYLFVVYIYIYIILWGNPRNVFSQVDDIPPNPISTD